MKPSEFLEVLWGPRPPGLVQLWQLAGKRSFYLRDPAQADFYADGATDIYTAVGLAHTDHGRARRARADEIIAIAGLWLDIDVNGGPLSKTGGVPDELAAWALATRLVTPTIAVASGYGLHAWYLFEQPWRFASRDEQQAAATASAQWYALHRRLAVQRDWGLDHTHDLSRLLRPPGTFNGKGGARVPVHVLPARGDRFDRDQLLALAARAGPVDIDLPGAPRVMQADVETDAAVMRNDVPVKARLEALIANDPVFCDTWRNERRDCPAWSMSEYDLAIATMLARADWSNTDIAAAITLHRRRHDPNDPKAHRVDYLQRTVARARESAIRGHAAEQLRLLAAEGSAAA